MYCSHCGSSASGNFCAACGTALAASTSVDPVLVPMETSAIGANADWTNIADCDRLLQIPMVRDRIASSAAKNEKRMTGEQFLELCDRFISPLTAGVPLAPVAKLSLSFYAKLGVKTGKARTEYVRSPIGSVIVDTLCSLAERGQELKSATSAENGCILEAALPSDFFSFAGSLIVTVEQSLQATRVEAATVIPGQLYDWGKSSRALNALFDQLRQHSRAA